MRYDTLVGPFVATRNCCYCNVAFGNGAIQYAYCATSNVVLGPRALYWGYYANGNIAAGYEAGKAGVNAYQAVMLGYRAGYYAYSTSCSVYIGACAGYCACQQRGAVVIGFRSGLMLNRYGGGDKGVVLVGAYEAGRYGYNTSTLTSVGNLCCGCSLVAIGSCTMFQAATSGTCACNQTAIGFCAWPPPVGSNSVSIGSVMGNTTYLCGCLSKTAGSFKIKHPEPNSKKKYLYHSFVESPNRGDNLYRYKFNVCNCEHRIKLPNYYKYLNECNMAWVYAVNHFGEGYAKVDKEDLVIKTNKDGCYNVLLMGTRCDPLAVRDWEGVETIG